MDKKKSVHTYTGVLFRFYKKKILTHARTGIKLKDIMFSRNKPSENAAAWFHLHSICALTEEINFIR